MTTTGLGEDLPEHLDRLCKAIQLRIPNAARQIEFAGKVPGLGTPLRVLEAGQLALAAQALSIAGLDRMAARPEQLSILNRECIVFALRPFPFLRHNGAPTNAWGKQISAAPCSGHMATADGRYVYMANVVPRLRDRTLRVLGCAGSREAVEAAVLTWKASELEQTMAEAGLPLTVVRTSEEWLASPQGGLMTGSPLVNIDQLGSSQVEPVPQGRRSLAGLKVLDLTHVVAGPMITRGLAEHGADVLHVGPEEEDLQDPLAVTDELMIGKRSAGLNLKSASGRREIERLIAEADVLVQSWRPGVMKRWGLEANRVAQLRPGIVQLSVSCYGPLGSWSERPGFDGNALAATGATNIEAGSGVPRLTPPGVLTDSLVGFLGVAVINSLLMDRAELGGSHSAHISLARIAMWLMELGLTQCSPGESASGWGTPALRRTTARDGGVLEHVVHPIEYQHRPARLSLPQPVLRASPPEWLDEGSYGQSDH